MRVYNKYMTVFLHVKWIEIQGNTINYYNVQDVYSLLLLIFSCLFFNTILLLAYEDASLLKHYFSTSKTVACTFQSSSLLLDRIFLTLSLKPGKNLVIVLSFVHIIIMICHCQLGLPSF